jgi:SAM-dependent methyltransferase
MGGCRFREEIILPAVKGRKVLDCGGADHWAFAEKQEQDTWLHARIAMHAAEVLGIDLLEERVRRINETGKYRFVCGNVESMTFREEFDVVVGGELIEHLHNPGQFLLSAWKALKPGGQLILTTPNATSVSVLVVQTLLRTERGHPEHTCVFTPRTLTYLVSHHGFRNIVVHRLNRPSESALIEKLRGLVIRLDPQLCETLLLTAEKDDKADPYGDKW